LVRDSAQFGVGKWGESARDVLEFGIDGFYTPSVLLTSDPHAWLRPYVATLKSDPVFSKLAPSMRFEALCQVVEVDQPDRARQMREWSPAAQTGTLKWLETVTKEKPMVNEVEMWRVTKGPRTLRCVARYLPIGIDLRLMEGDDFRRTEVHKDGDVAEIKAAEWRKKLEARGWQ
jgi:hypothetical protein